MSPTILYSRFQNRTVLYTYTTLYSTVSTAGLTRQRLQKRLSQESSPGSMY